MFEKSLALTLLAAMAGQLAAAPDGPAAPKSETLDLSKAVILTPPKIGRFEQKAVEVLQEEVRKRTGIDLPCTTTWPSDSKCVIALGLQSRLQEFAGPFVGDFANAQRISPEGFMLAVKRQPRAAVVVCAADTRGLLYGVGRLLRKLQWRPTCWPFRRRSRSNRRRSIRFVGIN